jgi:hypothetical protein
MLAFAFPAAERILNASVEFLDPHCFAEPSPNNELAKLLVRRSQLDAPAPALRR